MGKPLKISEEAAVRPNKQSRLIIDILLVRWNCGYMAIFKAIIESTGPTKNSLARMVE